LQIAQQVRADYRDDDRSSRSGFIFNPEGSHKILGHIFIQFDLGV